MAFAATQAILPLRRGTRHRHKISKDKNCLLIKLLRSKTALPQQDPPNRRLWMH